MATISGFSDTYPEAREKFLAACARRSLDVESLLNPLAKGARGEDLYTDVIRIGSPNASKVLLLTSGTHGVEGYCGSGVQVGLLNDDHFTDLPDDFCVVMIHAMNPYGFSHDRRVNEDNIDLNRNFIDFSGPAKDDSAYAAVHPFVLPAQWEGAGREEADAALAAFIAENGQMALQAALSGGQYTHADGIFYGGRGPSWSREMSNAVLQKYARGASDVGVIDFHTGLGPYGYGELISDGTAEHKARTKRWYGDQATDPEAGTSTSAPLSGTFAQGVVENLPDARVSFIALEYGTREVMEVLQALRGDNWLYQHSDVHSELGAAIKREIKDAFYPNKNDWKSAVWTRAVEVIDMAMKGLAQAR